MSEKTFANGIIFKLPNEKAPDYVKGSLSIKVNEAIEFLQSQNKEWVNLDLLIAKSGKPYCSVNEWTPKKPESKPEVETEEDSSDPLPF